MPWRSESRTRFLVRVFVVGMFAPAVLVGVNYALRDLPFPRGHPDVFAWILFCIYFAAFPTQIVFLDAEQLPAILFLLVVVAPLNGAWYVLVAVVFWLLRDGLRRLFHLRESGEGRSEGEATQH